MELTKERALELHRRMWTDMQKDLSNNPSGLERERYKRQWCQGHFPDEGIQDCCFLCGYAYNKYKSDGGFPCKYCPIKWDCVYCFKGSSIKKSYRNIPISELLTLPERELRKEN